ncbi:MAG: hypothetical protein Q4A97_02675 [Comamonadaceae bacterium]|nr:hypothetical protein [Comamonadaceae bacterium]
MLHKLLLTGLVLAAAVLLWAWLRRGSAALQQRAPQAPPPMAMVPCQVCGAQLDRRLATPCGRGHLCREHRHLARQLDQEG